MIGAFEEIEPRTAIALETEEMIVSGMHGAVVEAEPSIALASAKAMSRTLTWSTRRRKCWFCRTSR
jgi:hypothetical protein